MKATAHAPSNIAFIKYWGKKNEEDRLPANGSISMNLSNLYTTTTVEFSRLFIEDSVLIDDQVLDYETHRVIQHVNRIRRLAGISDNVRIQSYNSFPTGRGLSSSASGFAALTVAASAASGLELTEKELSMLARQGSGSACRSIPRGFVEWVDGDTSEDSYAESLYAEDYWDLRDIVVVTGTGRKEISTQEGMKITTNSPFYTTRLNHMNEKIHKIKKFLAKKDFHSFGELIEHEALEMHAVMMTSHPSLLYWTEKTVSIMKSVQRWRREGLSVYFTINTGQDIHLLCEGKNQDTIVSHIHKEIDDVELIVNTPDRGAHITENHLF